MYLDPGFGSMIIQVVIAFFAAFGAYIVLIRKRLSQLYSIKAKAMEKILKMKTKEFSSFRDPSGFVFKEDGVLYRQINPCYKSNLAV